MIDYGYLRGNGADTRDMCRKNVVVSGGIGPDKIEGGGSNRREAGGGIYGGRSRGISRELIHVIT